MILPFLVAEIILWGVIGGSLFFSFFAFMDSIREYHDVKFGYEQARIRFSNGRVRVAEFRKHAGLWYVIGFGMMVPVFILVAYRNFADPPDPDDTLLLASLTRILALFVVFSFWRTMRGQRQIRRVLREADEIREIKNDIHKVKHVADKTYAEVRDVNEKVSEQHKSREESDAAREVSDAARAKADEARAVSDEAREVSDRAREEDRG